MEQQPTVKQGSLLFFITFLIFATAGIYLQGLSVHYGLIVTEWIIVLLPVLIYIRILKLDIRSTLRLNPLSLKEFLLSIGIGITGWLVAYILGAIVVFIFWQFGLKIPELPIPIPKNIYDFLILTFIVSISAGICEETMFRGFIMRSFENGGIKSAIIMSALLFALMHGSLFRFLPIFFLGIVYGWVAWRTNSIFSTMITHSINNGLSLLLMTLVPSLMKNPTNQIVFGIAALFFIILSLVLLPVLLSYLYRSTQPPLILSLYSGNRLVYLLRLWSFDLGMIIYIVLAGWEMYSIIIGSK